MTRISCATCKAVVVERVPWATGKERVTTSFAWFLASWAKRMSWKQVAVTFGVSWDTVYSAVKLAVAYGLEHRSLEGVTEIGVDKVMWRAGKRKYLTVVYQINEGFRPAASILHAAQPRLDRDASAGGAGGAAARPPPGCA